MAVYFPEDFICRRAVWRSLALLSVLGVVCLNIRMLVGSGDSGFLSIGVPCIQRSNGLTYLRRTLDSLVAETSVREKTMVSVLVFMADRNETFNNQAHRDWYPDLQDLKRNFRDRPDRVRWRAKQVADYAFLFAVARRMNEFYLQLEDDVQAAPAFLRKIRSFISLQGRRPWAVLEFSELGFIGKLFRSRDLDKLSRYMLTFYDEQPVDWLIRYFRLSMAQSDVRMRRPTLFQHFGEVSSYDTSKRNPLKDRFFDSGRKRWAADDPPGAVSSSMPPFQQHVPELCYGGGDSFFWATRVRTGDVLQLVLAQAATLARVAVATGSPAHPSDRLQSGVLEVSPRLLRAGLCADYRRAGDFREGSVDVTRLQTHDVIQCVRVRVTDSQDQWVVFYQIAVWLAT